MDVYGNLYKIVGEGSKIVWSSHTDTVHRKDGFQAVQCIHGYASLTDGETISNCLGADCTTGVYIMMEMIKAEIPGLYIFHRDEEIGGLGSNQFAITHRELLQKYDIAIAFDRRATNSVITHQMQRGCSEKFAESLIAQLPGYRKDDGGVFTDTANYINIIPECTNLSVGYYNEHSVSEMQDVDHMETLISYMISLEPEKLIVSRDPNAPVEYPSTWGWGRNRAYYDDDSFWNDTFVSTKKANKRSSRNKKNSATVLSYDSDFDLVGKDEEREVMIEFIKDNPTAIAFLLEQYGLTLGDLEDFTYAT